MKTRDDIKMMTPTTIVLLLLMGLGLLAAIYRLVNGLGAATNLNDMFPWGFWIGLDVMGGVAMAAGGFLIAGAVYILNIKKYKPIVRPAVLTAFFGYLLAIFALFLDIGKPTAIWHPAVMWQIHSVMWVVAIHVILYTLTLAVESSPMVFEKLNMRGALNVVEKIMVPVVLFRVLLSLLHQSSLGAVYLIAQGKLSPLWYSSALPYHFLLSAIMMGLSMVSFEYILSAKAFKHEVDMDIVNGLARGSVVAIAVYLVVRIAGLAAGPGLGVVFDGSMEANMFLLETLVAAIVPLVLFLAPGVAKTRDGIFTINILVIAGVLLNRMNVAIFGVYRDASVGGASYFPSLMEIVITAGLIALAVFGFKLAAKYLNLFPETSSP